MKNLFCGRKEPATKGAFSVKAFPRSILLAFVLATLGGTLLHFVYDFVPNVLTAMLSPVSESLWEHLKLLYWPYLVALLILTRKGDNGTAAPWLLTLLLICGAMLGIGWWYHVVFGGESTFSDIALYVLLMAVGFFLPRLLGRLPFTGWMTALLWMLVLALGFFLIFFTWRTPRGILFVDLSAVRTWQTIPF